MKTFKLILPILSVFLLIFLGCDNEMAKEVSSSNSKEYIENRQDEVFQVKMQQPVFNDFITTFGDFIVKMQEINSSKEIGSLQELTNLYGLSKDQPDKYLAILEANINSLYTADEIAVIKKMYNNMTVASEKLCSSSDFKNLTKIEQDLFKNILVLEIPKIKSELVDLEQRNRIKTRSESNCVQNCKDNYHYRLLEIAAVTICIGGVGVITACASLGTMSIPALIAAIAAVGGASIEIDKATIDYNMCLKGC